MTPRQVAGLALAVGVVGLLAGDGVANVSGAPLDRQAFGETAWPFLLDQWGRGRAFRCEGPNCSETRLYVRSKVGFCDCFNHVNDDDDIDRLTDFDLIGGDRVVPLEPGRPVTVAGQPARRRAFHLAGRHGEHRAVAVVVATECQALVGMLVSDRDAAPAVEAAALDVLRETLVAKPAASSSGKPASTLPENAPTPGAVVASTHRTGATR